MDVYFQGFGVSFGLIVAIGAQNAFVLKQGIKRDRIGLVCLVCSLCDTFLILIGVLGLGSLIAQNESMKFVLGVCGFAFLVIYGLRSFFHAFQNRRFEIESDRSRSSNRKLILTTLAFSLLNPHAILDTTVLIGGVSAQYETFDERFVFALGALSASFAWFALLGWGALTLAPLFAKPVTWKILDLGIAFIMWAIAAAVAVEFL